MVDPFYRCINARRLKLVGAEKTAWLVQGIDLSVRRHWSSACGRALLRTGYMINRDEGGRIRLKFVWEKCLKLIFLVIWINMCLFHWSIFGCWPASFFLLPPPHAHGVLKPQKYKNRGLKSWFWQNIVWQKLFNFVFAFEIIYILLFLSSEYRYPIHRFWSIEHA